MIRIAAHSRWWALGLMLLSALLLFAAPALPATGEAMLKDECCVEAPCHDHGAKAPCPTACAVACQAIVAPETSIAKPADIGAASVSPRPSRLPPGRAPAPELPPPR